MDFATEQGKTDEVLGDIKGFKKATENRDLFLLLKSPIVKPDKKASILKAIFEGKINDTTLAFFDIIVRKGREMYLPEIATEFEVLYKAQNEISNVEIITATELDDAELEQIKTKLLASVQTQKSLDITKKVDPSILGGFIVKIGDKLYDASVKHKLDKLRKEFVGNDYVSKM